MGISYSPKIVTRGLVLCLDAANIKSYPGILGSELVTNSIVTQIDGTTFNVVRDAGQNIGLTLCNVEAGKTYYLDYFISSYTGTVSASFRINNNGANLTPTTGISSAGRFNAKFTANVSGSFTIIGDNTGTNLLVDYVSVREVLSGTGQTWFDLSGNGRNGTLTNGPTYGSSNGGSIVFDGVDDFVIGTSNLPISGDSTFTISYWAIWDAASFSGGFPSGVGNNSTGVSNSGLSTTWSSGRIALDFWNNRFRANTPLNVQQWYHVSFVKSAGPTSSTVLYVNGVSVPGAVENGDLTPNITLSTFVVGRLDATRLFQGRINGVMIYNRALSAAEVQQNFNATRGRYGI